MRVKIHPASVVLWLSESDTWAWATRPGAAWPGSFLKGKRLRAEFDSNGLTDYAVDGKYAEDMGVDEFNAITSDYLKDKLPKDHPCYDVVVGQFNR